MTAEAARPRRTQQQRRDATVTKLVDATVDAIGEIGYQRTTVQEICGRAGLSTGAMFRQFDSRLDLIVRTAEEIFERQLSGFREIMRDHAARDDGLDVALRFLRQAQRSNRTHALRELYLAARSDDELLTRLTPIAENYYRQIVDAVESAGVLSRFPQSVREPLFFLLMYTFSGEAVVHGVYPRPDLDDKVLTLLEQLLLAFPESLRLPADQ